MNGSQRTIKTHNYSGYRHGCRCEVCTKDNNRYDLEMRYDRRERLLADPTLAEHGKLTTYHKWMCRCDACYLVHSDYTKAARERRLKRPRTDIRRRYKSQPFGREWLRHA